jgi:MscS family membrane protein
VFCSTLTHTAVAQPDEHPLEPAATSSPRETFHTLLTSQEQMWALVRDEGAGRRSKERFNKLMELDALSKRTLDLTGVAPEARRETAGDVVVLLYEVLTRIELPSPDEIPGDAELEEALDLDRWTVPHTEITLHRVEEGPREGEYLFTPETVARAEEFYERTKHLPYRVPPPIENVSEFLETYGGWDVPIAWIDALPDFMRRIVGGQALWKWAALVTSVILFLVLFFGVYRRTRRERGQLSVGQYFSKLTVPVLLLVGSVFGLPALSEAILLTGHVAKYLNLIATAIGYLSLAWIIWILILAAGEALANRRRVRTESLDASLIRLTTRLVAIGAVVILVFQGATAIGIPLVGVVASVSIGGLAVALAAQDTLKNLLGSLMIFIDQPYRVGERIIAGDHDGVVEQIGLRSTRIRQLDGHLTSIPNEKMATMDIENVERREHIRRKTQLRIATGTPRKKVEEALAIVKDILKDHEGMRAEQPPRVYFQEFNPDSLSIIVFYWYAPPDYWAFCEFGERVNLEIVRRFSEAGIGLAPPTTKMQITHEADESIGQDGRAESSLKREDRD